VLSEPLAERADALEAVLNRLELVLQTALRPVRMQCGQAPSWNGEPSGAFVQNVKYGWLMQPMAIFLQSWQSETSSVSREAASSASFVKLGRSDLRPCSVNKEL
jgi:hypothetical protein